jgi:hypothetical protein
MKNTDRVLLGPTTVDVRALLAIDAGHGTLTPAEIAELRAKGWLDPNCDTPLITLEGRVLIERNALRNLLAAELR